MTNDHTRSGASDAFADRMPRLAALLGTDTERARARYNLGRRNWAWHRFGRPMAKAALLVTCALAAIGAWLTALDTHPWLTVLGTATVLGAATVIRARHRHRMPKL